MRHIQSLLITLLFLLLPTVCMAAVADIEEDYTYEFDVIRYSDGSTRIQPYLVDAIPTVDEDLYDYLFPGGDGTITVVKDCDFLWNINSNLPLDSKHTVTTRSDFQPLEYYESPNVLVEGFTADEALRLIGKELFSCTILKNGIKLTSIRFVLDQLIPAPDFGNITSGRQIVYYEAGKPLTISITQPSIASGYSLYYDLLELDEDGYVLIAGDELLQYRTPTFTFTPSAEDNGKTLVIQMNVRPNNEACFFWDYPIQFVLQCKPEIVFAPMNEEAKAAPELVAALQSHGVRTNADLIELMVKNLTDSGILPVGKDVASLTVLPMDITLKDSNGSDISADYFENNDSLRVIIDLPESADRSDEFYVVHYFLHDSQRNNHSAGDYEILRAYPVEGVNQLYFDVTGLSPIALFVDSGTEDIVPPSTGNYAPNPIPPSTGDDVPNPPSTGDNAPIFKLVVLMLASFAVGCMVIRSKRFT